MATKFIRWLIAFLCPWIPQAQKAGELHSERAKSKAIPVTDRGRLQGNLTRFKPTIFVNENLSGLILIPAKQGEGGVSSSKELVAQGVTDLGTYRGAYDYDDKGSSPGSDWMPQGLGIPKTMAQSERFASKYRSVSITPEIRVSDLPRGVLSPRSFDPATDVQQKEVAGKKGKRKNKKTKRQQK